jgi:hypothetical protein
MKPLTKLTVFLLILVVYLLHQDFWNWKKTDLIFGFMPVGLAYHAGYSVLASITMALLVRLAWPKHLENVQTEKGVSQAPGDH